MDRILKILIDQWEYDIAVMSQPWMYYWLLVPIVCYVFFFLLKWTLLTAPVWLPLSLVFKSFVRVNVVRRRGKE